MTVSIYLHLKFSSIDYWKIGIYTQLRTHQLRYTSTSYRECKTREDSQIINFLWATVNNNYWLWDIMKHKNDGRNY